MNSANRAPLLRRLGGARWTIGMQWIGLEMEASAALSSARAMGDIEAG